MQYHGASYAEDAWDVYWYEKNIFGDVVAVYDEAGTKLISYKYDAYGNWWSTQYNGGYSTTAYNNPFRYRGYYYDRDLELYYLNSRYYDCYTCRFISADAIDVICSTPNSLVDKNLYTYCDNNPIMCKDPRGQWVDTIFDLFSLGVGIIELVINPFDPLNWLGTVGDAFDLLPIVTGTGETIRGVRIMAKGADLADDAYDTIRFVRATDMMDHFTDEGKMLNIVGNKSSYKKMTISNHKDGTFLHNTFMNNGKTIENTRKRLDGHDSSINTIYELKPYNKRNIRKGVRQISGYNKLMGGGNTMIIVLY